MLSKQIIFGIVTVLIIIVGGLGTVSLLMNANPIPIEGKGELLIIDESLYQTAPRDQCNVTKGIISEDTLTLDITFTGGLTDHDFDLITTGALLESYPVQIYILLSHDANNDSGEAEIRIQRSFDLSPLRESYQSGYQTSTGEIIIHLEFGSVEGILGSRSIITLSYVF